jgi:two-component system chemotaxis sensor kinase CheA
MGRTLGLLGQALRGRGELEDKLRLLGAIGGALFVTLVVTLFYVQQSLGRVQRQLAEQAMPAEQEIARLETSLGAAFRRQAQMSSTVDMTQVEAIRVHAVEPPLRETAHELVKRLTALLPAARTGELDSHVAAFLHADAALLAAVQRRHELQARFEKELGAIDGDLRALVEDSQAVSGMLRLEYVLVLRGVAESLDRGAPRINLVRTAVLGDVRGALDDTGELANAVLGLGWLGGKLGLAVSSDAINTIAANELPQNRMRIVRLIAALEQRTGGRPEAAARVRTLAGRFDSIAPRIMDEKLDGSLVSLRRRVVAEAASATKIRTEALSAADALTADTTLLQHQVAEFVAESVRDQSRTSTSARLFSALATLLGLLGCIVAGYRIHQAAKELAGKNLRLTELKGTLESLNVNLESKVAERTGALVERDRGMQRVLDSMHEGLVTVSLDGSLRAERSGAFTEWFGDPGRAPIWDVLYPDDATRAGLYQCGFEQIADDILPFEVAIDQLPRQIRRGERVLEVELRAVDHEGRLDAVLFVIRDVTERIGALAAERAAREEQKVIANLLRDRRGFQRSIEEIQGLIAIAHNPNDASALRRALHTIKGNCAVLGFTAMAEHAHALEAELDRDAELPLARVESLQTCFQDSLKRIQEFIAQARGRIDIDSHDYATLVDGLRTRRDYDTILGLVERWELEPIGTVLQGLAGHARRLADQMGRRVDVTVEGNGIRVGSDGLRSFCASLVHAVRNAVDHGIEGAETRAAAGKPAAGQIKLSATVRGEMLVVSVRDDGAGVDIDRIRQRALALGLPCETRAEVLDALFADGLTTRTDVTELSGRGVGTSAVRAACRELGGDAEIVSDWGRGTELRCLLPLACLGTKGMSLTDAA